MADGEDRQNGPTSDGRSPDGRFGPGNPGRPTGSRHKVSLLLERIMAADGAAVTRAVVEAAKSGDMAAARLILDRLVPVRKGRTVALELPEVVTAADVPKAVAALLAAVGSGEVTPDEGAAVAGLIETARRAIETVELEQRLAALEERTMGGRP